MKREEVTELVDRGLTKLSDALASGKSEQLKEYLAVMARFPKYSFNNAMLIYLQAPDSSLVQGFRAWRKIGRKVIKGQKGIGIIAPLIGRKKDEDAKRDELSAGSAEGEKRVFGFKVVHVFDVSQTEGDKLPEIAAISGEPGENIAAIESLIRSWEIELVYEQIESGADGLSKKGTIVIAPDLGPAKQLLTLVHEAAHEVLHADAERRKTTTKTIRETEAEAVAFVVCSALGIDCVDHSSDYIQLYSGDTEVLTKSLEAIQKTAAQILEGIQKFLSENEAKEVCHGS